MGDSLFCESRHTAHPFKPVASYFLKSAAEGLGLACRKIVPVEKLGKKIPEIGVDKIHRHGPVRKLIINYNEESLN